MPLTRRPGPAPGRDAPHRLAPDERFDIAAHDTTDTGRFADEEEAEARLVELRERMSELQDRFTADEDDALLIVLQGFDGAGKDSVISHVVSACDPAALHVFSFNKPAGAEADHDFLWRFHQQTPPLGNVHVFDRSYYEEVIATRVHGLMDEDVCSVRYDSINDFERILTRDRTVILKFFLHVSKDKQADRVRERLTKRSKHHEFGSADVEDRELWDEYDRAYEDAINATNTEVAPWHAIPADHRWYVRVCVAEAIVQTLEELDPQYPLLDPEELEKAGLDPADFDGAPSA